MMAEEQSKRKRRNTSGDLEAQKIRRVGEDQDEDEPVYSEDENDIFEDIQSLADAGGSVTPLTLPSRAPSATGYRYSLERPDENFDCPKQFEVPIQTRSLARGVKICQECGVMFQRQDLFERHLLESHSTTHEFKCGWSGCSEEFVTEDDLKQHYKVHPGSKTVSCPEVPARIQISSNKTSTQRHVGQEQGKQRPMKKWHQCTEINHTTGQKCTSSFSKATRLKQHVQKAHEAKLFWCAVCIGNTRNEIEANALKFIKFADLQSHQRVVHPPTCAVCSRVFEDMSSLERHEATHRSTAAERKSWNCPEADCQKSFTSKKNLNGHLRAAHAQGKRFVCGEEDVSSFEDIKTWDGKGCGQSYGHKVSLVNHVRTYHLGMKQRGYKRNQRKERAKRMSTTALGEAEKEDGIRCSFADCPHTFGRVADLREHLRGRHGLEEHETVEAIAEQEALDGGPFWIGGAGDAAPDWLIDDHVDPALLG